MDHYLKSFDPRIVGLFGMQAQINGVTKEYRVFVSQQKAEAGGDYLVSHSAYIYLMDPRGTFVDVTQGSASAEELADWLRNKMAHSNE